jgi:UDP-N-acetyl-2-amino-2-deoxyglucuronate dehydrogenase
MLHLGFTGGGNITQTHIRAAAAAGQKIEAVYGTNAGKVEELVGQHGGTAYSDFDRFLSHRPMQLVVLGSPSAIHADEGIAAVRRGLHVLTEKPIDVTTRRADLLIDAARAAGVKLGVIFQDRLKPDILRVKNWIDSGTLGRPILAAAAVKWYRPPEYYSGSKWRGTLALDGGGALMNQGIHTLDLLIYLLGNITRVQSVTKTAFHKIESEDTCVATLEFASGAVGVLHATTAAFPGYARRVEITGTQGTVCIEQDRITRVDLRQPVSEGSAPEQADQNASSSSPVVSDIRGHQRIIEDFVESIQTGRASACDGIEGRKSLAVVEAIYRAAQARDAVLCGAS